MVFNRLSQDTTDNDESKEGLLTHKISRERSWLKLFFVIFVAAASGALVATLIAFLFSGIVKSNVNTVTDPSASTASDSTPPDLPNENQVDDHNDLGDSILHCGSTPAEARSLGCIYDVMMQDWMPEPCYDATLTERYLAEGNWTWWSDPDAQNIMTDNEMRKGEHSVAYMLQTYHKAHCIFTWEKTVRAVRNNAPMIEELISYDHVLHCREKTLSDSSDQVRGVRAPTAFSRCAKYSTWIKDLPHNAHSTTD